MKQICIQDDITERSYLEEVTLAYIHADIGLLIGNTPANGTMECHQQPQ